MLHLSLLWRLVGEVKEEKGGQLDPTYLLDMLSKNLSVKGSPRRVFLSLNLSFFTHNLIISLRLPFSGDERKEIQWSVACDFACFVCLFCYALVCYVNLAKNRVVPFSTWVRHSRVISNKELTPWLPNPSVPTCALQQVYRDQSHPAISAINSCLTQYFAC